MISCFTQLFLDFRRLKTSQQVWKQQSCRQELLSEEPVVDHPESVANRCNQIHYPSLQQARFLVLVYHEVIAREAEIRQPEQTDL